VHATVETKVDNQIEMHFRNGLPVTAIVLKTVAGPQRVSDENIKHTREGFVLQHTTVEHVRYKSRF